MSKLCVKTVQPSESKQYSLSKYYSGPFYWYGLEPQITAAQGPRDPSRNTKRGGNEIKKNTERK